MTDFAPVQANILYPQFDQCDTDETAPNNDRLPNIGQSEIFIRHVPLKVLCVTGAEVIRAEKGDDPWKSDLRVQLLLPYNVDLRSLSGQVLPDRWWDITSMGSTLTLGYLTLASADAQLPPGNSSPTRVDTIIIPLTRGRPSFPPLFDRIRLNEEASAALHHTVKIPGVSSEGREVVWRIRCKIDVVSGEAYIRSINADPVDSLRIKEATHNFHVALKHLCRKIKSTFTKTVPEPATSAQPAQEEQADTADRPDSSSVIAGSPLLDQRS